MKYIRTKDNIWEYNEHNNQARRPNKEMLCQTIWCNVKEIDILQQADTIEELCDECISVLENGKGSHIWHESDFEEKTPYLFHNARMFKEDDEIIYGAIWTDKGLIYVAKMNEKGELELL